MIVEPRVQDRSQLAAVRNRYGLPQSYVLYLGGFEPRKNIARLVEAYALLPETVQDRCALVLAGSSQREQPALEALASRLGVRHRLVLPGVIAENDKPAVLSAAQAFTFPSLYEGFGLPPLEAMACGTPVLASNVSSIPEIVGDGALLVSPTDVPGIASGLEQLISNDKLRGDLKDRGLEIAGQYAWAEVARRVLDVYRQIGPGGAA